MCGIIGGYDRERRPFGQILARKACRSIAHRGPDDEGVFEADGVLLGNRRLSILDVAGGQQPMFSDDGQIVVVQNGEIYNYVELSRELDCRTTCDTEVILRLYERDGEDFVKQLNGMFAIAVLDRRKRRLLLYRDRVGKKPLYLFDDGCRLLFASEIKALLAMGVQPRLNWNALDAFLTYNYVPPPVTLFEGIRHLPPGHALTVDSRGVRERSWWQLGDQESEDRPDDEWCDEILATLDDAVRIRLRSDVPLGAFLSGGIDSSSVVSVMSRQISDTIRTFCIGFAEPRFDESRYAQQVADYCGTDHTCEVMRSDLADLWPLTLYHNDQPHGDVSFLPTYRVSQLARRSVKVVLTGDGGDELYAGYDVHRRFLANWSDRGTQAEFEREYVRAFSVFEPEAKTHLYTAATAAQLSGADAFAFAAPHFDRVRHWDRINQALAVDVGVLLPANNLVKPDRMAMAVGLEPRAPFLDHRMIDLSFRIPGHMKLRDGITKWILKRASERLLPRNIVHRRKQMFTVLIGEWFKGPLLHFAQEALQSKRTTDRGIFDPKRVSAMIEDHAAGQANYTRQIRALIAFELWQRIFMDASFDCAPTFEELGIRLHGKDTTTARIAAA